MLRTLWSRACSESPSLHLGALGAQVYALERLAAGDLEGAGPLVGALAGALGRLHKGAPEWAPFAATLARRLAVRVVEVIFCLKFI